MSHSDIDIELDHQQDNDWVVSDIVTLNVGGTMFQTAVSILTEKSDFFRKAFSNNSSGQDKSQPLFIDRDPALFKQILSYMRNENYSFSNVDIKDIITELEFFEVEPPQQLESPDKECVTLEISPDHIMATGLPDDIVSSLFKGQKNDKNNTIYIINPVGKLKGYHDKKKFVGLAIKVIWHKLLSKNYKLAKSENHNDFEYSALWIK